MHGLLRVLPAEKKKKWADHLKEVVHAYNVTPHGSIGYSPHYLMFGRDSRLPIDVLLGGEESSCDGWVQQHQRRLHDAYAKAATQLNSHADQRKARHDRHARELPLAAGERVYRETVRDHVDREEASLSSPVVDSSSTSDNEVEDVRPVTLRRTCRTRAGTHTNPGNWPRSAKR